MRLLCNRGLLCSTCDVKYARSPSLIVQYLAGRAGRLLHIDLARAGPSGSVASSGAPSITHAGCTQETHITHYIPVPHHTLCTETILHMAVNVTVETPVIVHQHTLAPQGVAVCKVEEALLADRTQSTGITVNIGLAHTLAGHIVAITDSSHCPISITATSYNATRVHNYTNKLSHPITYNMHSHAIKHPRAYMQLIINVECRLAVYTQAMDGSYRQAS